MKILILTNGNKNTTLGRIAQCFINCKNLISLEHYEYGNKLPKDATVAFHFVDPKQYKRIPGIKNIGVLNTGCDNTEKSLYTEIMDYVIYLPLNFNTHIPNINNVNYLNIPEVNCEYVFYTTCDNFIKSSCDMLIKAFNLEFDPAEPVNLFIKTASNIDHYIKELKNGLDLYKKFDVYKKHIVFSKICSLEDECSIHKTFDCYVNTDYNYNLIATTYKKPVIFAHELETLREELRHKYKNKERNDGYQLFNFDVCGFLLESAGA